MTRGGAVKKTNSSGSAEANDKDRICFECKSEECFGTTAANQKKQTKTSI